METVYRIWWSSTIAATPSAFSMETATGRSRLRLTLWPVARPVAAVAGDFYGDGHVDLAIINHASQTVSVPSGNGDGTFKAARSYLAGVQPVSIASGNLNGSNVPALVVANYCGSDSTCASAGNVAIFLTDSKGKLSSLFHVHCGQWPSIGGAVRCKRRQKTGHYRSQSTG
jgi:hypothetical protein